jgi:hypothetical protein
MANQTWDERLAAFFEKVMASAVVGADPKPLQEEYAKLLAEVPASKKKALGLTPLKPSQKAAESHGKPTKPSPTR